MSSDEEKHDDLAANEKPAAGDDAVHAEPKKKKKKRRRAEDDLAESAAPEPSAEEEEETHDDGGEAVDEGEDEEDPYWWTPHATLFALIVLGILGFFGAFRQKTADEHATREGAPTTTTTAASQPTNVPINPRQLQAPSPTAAAQQPPGEQIEAAHLIVMHKDSMRVPPGVTRTKEEAKKRAEEALAKLKKGTAFDQLVKDYSDEQGAGTRTPPGTLGTFGKGRMDPAFEAGAFALKPGETSGIVESKFGFHIIRRIKLALGAQPLEIAGTAHFGAGFSPQTSRWASRSARISSSAWATPTFRQTSRPS